MSSPTRPLLQPIAWLVALAIATTPAHATYYDWINWAGGDASVPSNWNPTGTPSAYDNAVFNAPATFTTTWASPYDSLAMLTVSAGNPNFAIADHLGVSSVLYVYGTSSLTVSSGRLTAGTLSAQASTLGQLIVSGGNSLVDAGSVNWGATGGSSALMTLQNGGQLQCRGALYLGANSGSIFVGDVHHRVKFGVFPLIRTVYPFLATVTGTGSFHDLIIGSQGSASLSAYDGGYVSSAGNLLVGGYAGSTGFLHTYVSGLAGGVVVAGDTYVGANTIGALVGGNGAILVEGWGNFVGRVWLGDPDDAAGGPVLGVLQVDNGGSAVLAGGLTTNNALGGRLDLTGGITQVVGGSVVIKQATPFQVGSAGSHAPVFWLENGTTTDVWPAPTGGPALGIGRAGAGTVNVARAGTALIVRGALAMGDSTGGFGTLQCDSSATATIQGRATLGGNANAFIQALHPGTVVSLQDTTVLGLGGGHTGAVEADSGATIHLLKTALVGAGSGGELLAYSGSHLDVAGATVGPAYGLLECGGNGATMTVSDHLDLVGSGFVAVDFGGVFAYTNAARAVTVAGAGGGKMPQFVVNNGGLAQLAAEFDVRGSLIFDPSNTIGLAHATAGSRAAQELRLAHAARTLSAPAFGGRLECPLTRILDYGQAIAVGTIDGRFHIDSGTGTLAVSENDAYFTGSLVAGDSTRSDGFTSIGATTVGLDTLRVLDSDGGDLGKVTIAGGDLQLPKPGHLKSGFRLSGNGTVEGSLDVRDSAWVSFNGQVTGDLALAGTLDLGPTTAGLVLGSLHPAATGRVTIKTGHIAQDVVIVLGAAALGGTLDLRSIPGDLPAVGDTFTVLVGTVSGTFTNVTFNGRPGAGVVHVVYRAGDVRVAIVGAVTAVGGPPAPVAPATLRLAPIGGPRGAAVALDLPDGARAQVAVFDVTGRELATLADDELAAGRHRFELAGRVAASGVYFARAVVVDRAGTHVLTTRLVVLR